MKGSSWPIGKDAGAMGPRFESESGPAHCRDHFEIGRSSLSLLERLGRKNAKQTRVLAVRHYLNTQAAHRRWLLMCKQ